MEQVRKVSESGNAYIIALSEELKKVGILDGSDVYYEDENFDQPFFKIPKAYKKEKAGDPDEHYVFVDVGEGPVGMEYTVTCNFVHEHIGRVEDAVTLIKGLYDGEIVEMALVYGDIKVSLYMHQLGDHVSNIEYLIGDKKAVDYVIEHMKNPMVQSGRGHQHLVFPKNFPYNLMFEKAGKHVLPNIRVYAVSAIFGEHPEYYVLE